MLNFSLVVFYISPSIVFAYIIIKRSQSEVEKKMTLYGVGLLILLLLSQLLTLYLLFWDYVFSSATDQLYRTFSRIKIIGQIIVSVLLLVFAIHLPDYTEDLRRHRIIVALYPFALIIIDPLFDFLISASTISRPQFVFGLLEFARILLILALLFVLINSTKRVFLTKVIDKGDEQMWPDAGGRTSTI